MQPSDINLVLVLMGAATMVFLMTTWVRGAWSMMTGRPSGLTGELREASAILTMVFVAVVLAAWVY